MPTNFPADPPARRVRIRRDWTPIDAALAALPTPAPYGALKALAERFTVPATVIYARVQARRPSGAAADNPPGELRRKCGQPPTAPTAAAELPAPAEAHPPARRSGRRGPTRGPAPPPAVPEPVPSIQVERPDPTRCPVSGCNGRRTVLADPHHMPTLPVPPALIARAGNFGACDGTPSHFSWVGLAGAEVMELEAA